MFFCLFVLAASLCYYVLGRAAMPPSLVRVTLCSKCLVGPVAQPAQSCNLGPPIMLSPATMLVCTPACFSLVLNAFGMSVGGIYLQANCGGKSAVQGLTAENRTPFSRAPVPAKFAP